MGCFSTCFGKSKRQRRSRRRPIKTTPCLLDHLQKHESVEDFQVIHLIEEENIEKPTDPLPEISDEKREKVNLTERKKVTFDLNVKIYEELPTEEQEELNGDSGENNEEKKGSETQSPEDSSSSSLFSYPPNHRYQNCRDSDDEFDELMSSQESDIGDDYNSDDENEDSDYDGECDEVESEVKNDDKQVMMTAQDQSSEIESLFSLSIDSRKQNLVKERVDDKEVNSPIPINDPNGNPRYDRSKYIDSVLNPVENVTQWKVIKARSKLARKDDQAKENNLNLAQDSNFEPVRKEQFEKEIQIGVDTSLSTWLVGSPNSNSKTSSVSVGNSASDKKTTISPNKFEDRPILGALTVEEIRHFSATSSPRKSPNRSPDDMPIIGSVGSYWSHTGQTTDSGSSTKRRSRLTESTKVIWDSTPFETRLEKALQQEGAC